MKFKDFETRYTQTKLVEKIIKNEFNISKTAKEIHSSPQTVKKVLAKPEVQRMCEEALETANITKDYVLSNIKYIVDTSLQESYDPQNALRGLELLGKYHKLFTDRTENMNVQTDFETYIKKVESDEEF